MFRRFACLTAMATLLPLYTAFADDTLDLENKKNLATAYIGPYGGIYFQTADGNFTSKISGYLQLAPVYFGGDTYNTTNTNTNIRQNLYSGFTIPEARLILSGKIYQDWRYEFSYDFVERELKDAYIDYQGFSHTELKGGQFKADFSSLGNITTRTYRTFIEDSLPVVAFIPDFLIGLQGRVNFEHVGFSMAVVSPPMDNRMNGLYIDPQGAIPIGATTRLDYRYTKDARHLLYTDISTYVTKSSQNNNVAFRTIPEMSGRESAYLVNTGIISNVNFYDISSAECATIIGPSYLEGGYYIADAHQKSAASLFFDGYTVEAGYFFTGEYRKLDTSSGQFMMISNVRHSYGAWQLGLRYSYVNLDDKQVLGGQETNESVILNWYPQNRFRFGLEYIYANATPSLNGLNRHANIAALLGQVML